MGWCKPIIVSNPQPSCLGLLLGWLGFGVMTKVQNVQKCDRLFSNLREKLHNSCVVLRSFKEKLYNSLIVLTSFKEKLLSSIVVCHQQPVAATRDDGLVFKQLIQSEHKLWAISLLRQRVKTCKAI